MKHKKRLARRQKNLTRRMAGWPMTFYFRGQKVSGAYWKGHPTYIEIRVPRLRKVIRMHSPNEVALKHEGQFSDEEFVELWQALNNAAQEMYRAELALFDEMSDCGEEH